MTRITQKAASTMAVEFTIEADDTAEVDAPSAPSADISAQDEVAPPAVDAVADQDDVDDESDTQDEPLGEAGQRALDRIKEQRSEARRALKAATAELDEIKPKLQETSDKLIAAESELARYKVALKHGLTEADVADLPKNASEEELDRFLTRFAASSTPRKQAPNPTQGSDKEAPVSNATLFANAIRGH